MRHYNTPGVAISVFKDDKVIYSKGFGNRDLESFLPMTPNTLLGIGSVTKSFTAFSILILEERGLLSIEDSVAKYLDFPPFSSHPNIKIKHLLSHSSGIPATDASHVKFSYTFKDFSNVYPSSSKEDFIAHISEAEDYIIYEPGKHFFYNNDMYTCLSFIIEDLTNMKFTEFIKNEIFNPLDMSRAVFQKDELYNDPQNNFMTGYRPDKINDKISMKKYDLPIGGYVEAGGGIYASMNEMMHYAECLLNKGNYKGKQLLSEEYFNKLWTSQISIEHAYGTDRQYCLGWTKDDSSFPIDTIGHGGGMGTSCTDFLLIPELKIAIICSQNSCTGPISLYSTIAASILMELDPLEQLPRLRRYLLFNELIGEYKTLLDLYSLKMELKGNVLYADFEIDDGSFTYPLLLHDEKSLSFMVCNSLADKRLILQFKRDPVTQEIKYVTYERYLYKRI